jgi:hypothetical protein
MSAHNGLLYVGTKRSLDCERAAAIFKRVTDAREVRGAASCVAAGAAGLCVQRNDAQVACSRRSAGVRLYHCSHPHRCGTLSGRAGGSAIAAAASQHRHLSCELLTSLLRLLPRLPAPVPPPPRVVISHALSTPAHQQAERTKMFTDDRVHASVARMSACINDIHTAVHEVRVHACAVCQLRCC